MWRKAVSVLEKPDVSGISYKASVLQSGINISEMWSFTASTLMVETEGFSETLDFSSAFTRLIPAHPHITDPSTICEWLSYPQEKS
jgi:hypothetical protein